MNSRTDVGMADMYLTYMMGVLAYVDFTYPYDFDWFCFFNARPTATPNWKGLTQPLDTPTWTLLVLTVATSVMFLFVYVVTGTPKRPRPENFELGTAFLFVWEVCFMESSKVVAKYDNLFDLIVISYFCLSLLRSPVLRLFVTPLLFGMLVLDLGYCGSLISFLCVPNEPKTLQTMEDLAKV